MKRIGEKKMEPKKLNSIERAKQNNSDYNEYMETVDLEYFINNKRAM